MLPWLIPLARRVERAYAARFSFGADGVAAGAEPIVLRGGEHGLLLLHGSGDTPQTLRYLAERLHGGGYTVHVPLLPGHGRSPRAFCDVSARVYLEAARSALAALRRETTAQSLVGLSMGGALAAQLAAEAHDVRALILLAPYLEPPASVRWAARLAWLWGLVLPYAPARGERSVHDPAARSESRAYGVFPPRALRALTDTAAAARRALPRITVPTLVVNSREDVRIPQRLATRALEALRAPIEERWVEGCGHVITVDYCRDAVAQLVLEFLGRRAR